MSPVVYARCGAGLMDERASSRTFVSRGGEKLAAALDAFELEVDGQVCIDLGSHVGGFVDCLLQRNAARVHSVDTCYGTLAWKLRRDPRVVVHERTNALHFQAPEQAFLVTIDVGWTRQHLILESARHMLQPDGAIISLVKPHYEAGPDRLVGGVLPEGEFAAVVAEVLDAIERVGFRVAGTVESPLRGRAGNRELLAYLQMPPA
ncbi:MAG: TlyA family rRNA (cytidine-2'-O)-methyltransferase [bacterium]|nr:TlyA family rRNA (cytidine-2'-O)-methyltransferase [bacterium]